MQAAVMALWWVGIVGALALTAIALAQIVQVVRHALEIRRLARATVSPALGIVDNTAMIGQLEGVLSTAGRLLTGVQAIGKIAAAMEGRMAALGRRLTGRVT